MPGAVDVVVLAVVLVTDVAVDVVVLAVVLVAGVVVVLVTDVGAAVGTVRAARSVLDPGLGDGAEA